MHQLTDLEVDEVSLVDKPANQLAKVVFFKRADMKCPECGGDMQDGACEECEGKDMMDGMMGMKKAVSGVQFVIGFKEGGGSEVQSVVFDSDKWDKEKAAAWLKDHNLSSGKVDETENSLRYRQHDPEDYTRFRMITPGKAISKGLKAKASWSQIQSKVGAALTEKYKPQSAANQMYVPMPWIRELYRDQIVYDYDGKCYRADWMLDDNGNVKIGDPVEVEVVYQDVSKAASDLPAEAYAYVPDKESSSTWKLPLWETKDGGPTARQVGMAMAALGPGGFRGRKVVIPAADLPAVKAKILAAWRKVHGKDEEVPEMLKSVSDTQRRVNDVRLRALTEALR